MTKKEFPFLDMKMRWTTEGELNFSVFRKSGQQLKYVGKESTHTPGTLRVIPSGVLNRLAKFTSRKPSLHSEEVDKVYPDHTNALRKAGLAPPDFRTMGDSWKMQDEKLDIENKIKPDVNKKKKRNVYFCVACLQYFSTSIHRVINGLKKASNLSWIIVIMSYHRFNNVAKLLNRYLTAKIGREIFSKDLIDR